MDSKLLNSSWDFAELVEHLAENEKQTKVDKVSVFDSEIYCWEANKSRENSSDVKNLFRCWEGKAKTFEAAGVSAFHHHATHETRETLWTLYSLISFSTRFEISKFAVVLAHEKKPAEECCSRGKTHSGWSLMNLN